MNDLVAILRMLRLLLIGRRGRLKALKQRSSIMKFRETVPDMGLRMNRKECEVKQEEQFGEYGPGR